MPDAVGGRRLLGLVQRMMRTGWAMARCVNRIAQQRLAGQDLARLAPAGFNPTATNALVVEAVGWTAALRERLLALAVRARLAPGLPRDEPPSADRAPRGRGEAFDYAAGAADGVWADWHNWDDLARPWRMGPGGIATAARKIAGLSDQDVVSAICDKLQRAAAHLGADADVPRIAALEAAARALCPDAAKAEAGAGSGGEPDGGESGAGGASDPGGDAAAGGGGPGGGGPSGGGPGGGGPGGGGPDGGPAARDAGSRPVGACGTGHDPPPAPD